jgi:DNA-directed RNA polymerase subunit delta
MSNEYRSWRTLLEDFKMGNISEDDARNYLDEMSYDMTEEEYEKAELKLDKLVSETGKVRFYDEEREYFENHPNSDIERTPHYGSQDWGEEYDEDEMEDEYEEDDEEYDDDYGDEEEEYDEDFEDEEFEEEDGEDYEDYDDD